MAASSTRILFVEGYSDKRFFQGLQRHMLDREQKVHPFDVKYPGEVKTRPGKSGAIALFEQLLKAANEPNRYVSLAICIDADQQPEEGFLATSRRLTNLMATNNFRLVDADRRIYAHLSSGTRASFWITPSHSEDGYLESLILNSLGQDEKIYLDQMVNPYLASIATPRFNQTNLDRAKLYTYLAIQRKPDKSLPTLLDDALVDLHGGQLADLCHWVSAVFQ